MFSHGLFNIAAGGVAALVAVSTALAGGGPFEVVSTSPARHTMAAPAATVSVTFNQPVLTSSFTAARFYAFGKSSGLHAGTFEFSNGDQTVTLRPSDKFAAGETVLVTLSNGLRAADNTPLRAAGYHFTFLIRAKPANMNFVEIASIGNRGNPPQTTRLYGAAPADYNNDGWIDLLTVNEFTADLRLLLNRADGSGLFDMVLPYVPIDPDASPNDTADFDLDGNVDVCTGNYSPGTVSVVRGNGDGTFQPQSSIPVGSIPRGMAAFDMDGDGDMDIACAAAGGNNVYLLRNNGNGTFAAPVAYNAGGGEYGLAFGDMNSDGIMDLVVGENSTSRVSVHLGNGNAGFAQSATVNCGGAVWVVALGDLNGDGHIDVTTANSGSSNGGVLFGNGAGGLSAVTTYSATGSAPSTDVGDLDGDGDLDWVLSSFGGGIWRLYENNGAGVFTFVQDFTADNNPSCAVLLDFDNDRDLDLALTDEVADVVKLYRNGGDTPIGDANCDGDIDFFDIDPFLLALFNPSLYNTTYPSCWLGQADVNEDGAVDFFDVDPFLDVLFD